MGKATSPRAKGKNVKAPNAKPLATAIQSAIDGGADLGYAVAAGQGDAVTAIRVITKTAKNKEALSAAQAVQLAMLKSRYECGYFVRYMADNVPAYLKRVDNMDRNMRYDDAKRIIDLPEPSNKSKPNRRTEIEHRAVKASRESWNKLRDRAFGIVRSRNTAPKAKVADVPATPPVDAMFASPKLANDNDAREYFRNAFAALLQTTTVNLQTGVKKEAKHVAFLVQSIIQDAKSAIDKVLA